MKNLKKLWICFLIVSIIVGNNSVYAASNDVTNSKADSMEDIIFYASTLPCINLYWGTKKLTFSKETKSIMAVMLDTYSKNRLKTTVTSVKGKMKLLFGTASGFSIKKSQVFPFSLLEKKGDKVYIAPGEWGDSSPSHMIKKITKVGNGKYKCLVYYYVENEEGVSYIGNFTFRLKTAKNSFGYIITGITQNKKCGYRKLVEKY